MRTSKWLMALGAALALLLFFSFAHAGSQDTRRIVLFGGSNTDSTEQLSPWFPIRGAHRIVMRFWSAKAAFDDDTDADSTYSDSIATFRVAFSDSMLRTNPLAAGDSVIFSAASGCCFQDTTTKLVALFHAPINESLRGPANGSGTYSIVVATAAGSVATFGDGSLLPQYARIYVTPLRRNTVTGGQSTAGKRVNGLKGFRGEALVITNNK